MRTAHSIARTGMARVRGEHLQAANDDPHAEGEGRHSEAARQATVASLVGAVFAIYVAARRILSGQCPW